MISLVSIYITGIVFPHLVISIDMFHVKTQSPYAMLPHGEVMLTSRVLLEEASVDLWVASCLTQLVGDGNNRDESLLSVTDIEFLISGVFCFNAP